MMNSSAQKYRLPYGALFWLVFLVMGGLLLAFILLPLLSLWITLSWEEFTHGLSHASVLPALRLSAITTLSSLSVVVLLGTPLAWVLTRTRSRKAQILETLIQLPAVLPPAVAGVALLLAFGRVGMLGGFFERLNIGIPFTIFAVIMAEIFVSSPFYLQAAMSAFRGIDESQITVAKTLGAGPWRIFYRIVLPLSFSELIAGALMSGARALGEFGATLMFAGNLPNKTQTLTLAVYTTFETDLKAAQAISLLLVIVAFTLLYVIHLKTKNKFSR